ncbi:MAG TPA: MFS transporter [Candidatus Dormibacteraeota bacterium]|nr:MFS transporter [Candidatus Dormibacteraeota bacterium]
MNSNLRRWISLVVVCMGQLMVMLDTTIVNVALPYIQRDLQFTQAGLTWVVNAYVIAYASFLLVAGRLGDLIGRRNVFLAGVFLFTVASVGSGFAQGPDHLIVGRFLQGLGGSLATGVIIAIIVTEFQKPAERAQAMSIFSLVIATGGSLGLLAGGFLTSSLNWHWIFFINVPIGIVTMALGFWLIQQNEAIGLERGVDIGGAILITASLMVGVYAIVTASDYGWLSTHTLEFAAASVLLLALFLAVEWRISNPILPLRVLTMRTLTGGSAARALLFAGMFTNFFVGALYMQHVKGYSAFETGLGFLPTTLAVGAMSSGLSARLMARFGARNLTIGGLTILVTALVLLSQTITTAGYFPTLFVAYLLLGIGAGSSFMPLLSISMSEIRPADAGLASGFNNVTTQVGGALGLATLGTVSTDHARALYAQGYQLQVALSSGYQLGFVLAAASVAAAIAVVLTVLRTSSRREAERLTSAESEAEAQAA